MNSPGEPIQLESEVTDVIQRTKNVKSVRFRRPKEFKYLPGQWAFLTVSSDEGQKTKPLSFSSSPTEDYLEFTKRLTGHEFSNAFAAMEMGDTATIRGPNGKLTLLENHKKICMLSGGIGVTPLCSMIRYSTDKELKTGIILLYSNRFEDALAFMDDFDEMQKRNPNFKVIITITRPSSAWKGLKGRINRETIEKKVPDYAERVFYSCGPKTMVDTMVAMLSNMGLPETQIKYEYFSGYLGTGEESGQ
ncbi:Sulfhydrogenase 1 subunit gamma [uncultured archaeon]|nr:Sulfhydrogenase 1 subunit gamma [uncultured archaeon]